MGIFSKVRTQFGSITLLAQASSYVTDSEIDKHFSMPGLEKIALETFLKKPLIAMKLLKNPALLLLLPETLSHADVEKGEKALLCCSVALLLCCVPKWMPEQSCE